MGGEAEALKRAGLAWFLSSCLNQTLVMIQSNFDSIFSFFSQAIYLFFKCLKLLQNK